MQKNDFVTNRNRDLFAIQGYIYLSSGKLKNLTTGIKLPHWVRSALVMEAILLDDIIAMAALTALAISGAVLPRHPVDYLYNLVLGAWLRRPTIPRRTRQFRFACSLAALFTGMALVFMLKNMFWTGYIFAYTALFISSLVGMLDICLPSMLYNLIIYKSIYPTEWKRMKILRGAHNDKCTDGC